MESQPSRRQHRRCRLHRSESGGGPPQWAETKGLPGSSCTRFGGADLRDCNLEEMVLTAPDFHDVDLRNALLTGSRMQEANFLGADFGCAGWPISTGRAPTCRMQTYEVRASISARLVTGLVGSPIAWREVAPGSTRTITTTRTSSPPRKFGRQPPRRRPAGSQC